MCGIVAGVAERNLVPIFLEGLKRLEYRGYDSAGIAVVNNGKLSRCRSIDKIVGLEKKVHAAHMNSNIGIAHTRWATHGAPSEKNAHPHMSHDLIAIVHNGIVENYAELRDQLKAEGYVFESDTDTEVVAHLIHKYYITNGHQLRAAFTAALKQLRGAFALAVSAADQPDTIVASTRHAPMVVGLGIGENFIASDTYALLPVTRRFIYVQDNDVVEIHRESYGIYDYDGNSVTREIVESDQNADVSGKAGYKHFMQKEMYEQPSVIAETMEGRFHHGTLHTDTFTPELLATLKQTKQVDIIACGTSYHAGLVIKFQLEKAGIRTNVEFASEYLYRDVAVGDATLFVCISQSGETADTLAALKKSKTLGYIGNLAVCNVPGSALVRAADHVLMTRAGREIGVASTKAFVTQLTALHILAMLIRHTHGLPALESTTHDFENLPGKAAEMLKLDGKIAQVAEILRNKSDCLYLGRGEFFAIAAEGALKLKELSYIHAEAYPCGELKHGPLALVDEQMPVVAVVKADALAPKVMSNLQEVQARGGKLIVFADSRVDTSSLNADATLISLGELDNLTASIAAVIPLQLFAYHVALLKGTDVDQPRNLAKAVTVE